MKKSDLLAELEKKFDYLPKREVERTLEKILQFFSSNLAKGNRIELRDFGTFVLTTEPIDEPKTKISKLLKQNNIPDDDFIVPKHGEIYFL